MRIIHIVPTVNEEAAGPSYSVPRLCRALIDLGFRVVLGVLRTPNIGVDSGFIKSFYWQKWLRRLGFSNEMVLWLKKEVSDKNVDVIHSHSLWMMPNVYPGRVIAKSETKLVVSPRGTLSRFALGINKWQKMIFWALVQKPALKSVTCFHATAESEHLDIRALGFKQPVCIIPNGIDVPPMQKKVYNERRQLLYLGRIHPKKGLDNLLHAWAQLEDVYPEWDLNIVGPDNVGHLPEMQLLAKKIGLKRVKFSGALFGEEKLKAYRQADVFVLPTHSENFGMTVAEALAAGTPTIVTKGAPWPGLELHNAGWWIEIGVDPLVKCLKEVLVLPREAHEEMGLAGRVWMLEEYSWESVGKQFADVYRWLLKGGEKPSSVRLD